jgi:FkbM family methyltransferase
MLITEMLDTKVGGLEVPVNEPYLHGALKHAGTYCPGEAITYQSIIQPGWTVLDIGANIGFFSLTFARSVGPAGRVLAFEPQPTIHDILTRNIEVNAPWVERFRAIVSDQIGTRPFVDLHNLNADQVAWLGSVSVTSTADGIHSRMVDTPALTLDSLGLARCDFIKIDVEGHEAAVIRGAAGTISAHAPILSLEAHAADADYGFVHSLKEQGYRFWLLRSRYVAKLRDRSDPLIVKGYNISDAVSRMLICVPNTRSVEGFNLGDSAFGEINNTEELFANMRP